MFYSQEKHDSLTTVEHFLLCKYKITCRYSDFEHTEKQSCIVFLFKKTVSVEAE